MRAIFSAILEHDPDAYLIWAGLSGVDYGKTLEHPQIMFFKVPNYDFFKTQHRESVHINSNLLDYICPDRNESLYYDVVINDMARSANYLAAMIQSPNEQDDIPIVNCWEFPTMEDDSYFSGTNKVYVRSMYHGMTCGYNVFETQDHERRMLNKASNYLAASEIKRVMDRTLGYMGSIDLNGIENNFKSNVQLNARPFRIHVSSRISSSTDVEGIIKIAENLFMTGRDIELVITTQSAAGYFGGKLTEYMTKKGLKYSIEWRCPQMRFFEIATSCHICIENSDHGDFSASFFERIMLGQIGIFVDKPWIKNILLSDYKFMYSGAKQMKSLIQWLYDNWDTDEVKIEVDRLRKHIRQRFNSRDNAINLHSSIKQIVDANIIRLTENKTPIREIATKAVKILGDKFSFIDYRTTVGRVSDTSLDPEKWHFSGRTTKFDHIRMLKAMGYKAIYDERHILRFSK